jgi:hypothetical protein
VIRKVGIEGGRTEGISKVWWKGSGRVGAVVRRTVVSSGGCCFVGLDSSRWGMVWGDW